MTTTTNTGFGEDGTEYFGLKGKGQEARLGPGRKEKHEYHGVKMRQHRKGSAARPGRGRVEGRVSLHFKKNDDLGEKSQEHEREMRMQANTRALIIVKVNVGVALHMYENLVLAHYITCLSNPHNMPLKYVS